MRVPAGKRNDDCGVFRTEVDAKHGWMTSANIISFGWLSRRLAKKKWLVMIALGGHVETLGDFDITQN